MNLLKKKKMSKKKLINTFAKRTKLSANTDWHLKVIFKLFCFVTEKVEVSAVLMGGSRL